jgi:hypothetical protein
MEQFLRARHWQIFMITFGLPFLIQVVLAVISITTNNHMILVEVMPFVVFLSLGGYFGWFWAIAHGLQKKLPSELKLNVTRFRIFMLLPILYFVFAFFMLGSLEGNTENGQEPNWDTFALIVPLHLFSMFCIFYCLYFVAKTYKTVELQRKVIFSDFIGEFFMIWIFPVGIWFIQPKINRLMKNPNY